MQYARVIQNLDHEYYLLIEDLIHNEDILRLAGITHHHFTNRLEHSITVSYVSYRLARKWNLNERAVARAGLLHDFFHEGREAMAKLDGGSHSYLHPRIALTNALQITDLSDLERDIILKHMFLVSKCWLPQFRESYLVTFVDKYIAIKEVSLPLLQLVRYQLKQRILGLLLQR